MRRRAGSCSVGVHPTDHGPPGPRETTYGGDRTRRPRHPTHCWNCSVRIPLLSPGPSATVNTARASSLTALHLAASSVRNDECDWALAGGVCVMGSPVIIYDFAKHNALSVDGHCRAYADDASGTLWGEGAGFVVVERETRARRLGHRVFGRSVGQPLQAHGKGKAILTPRR